MEIGKKRTFTFTDDICEIIDVIKNPNFKLKWKWKDIICPHCKKQITRETMHEFNSIEILVPEKKKDLNKNELRKEVICLGLSKDNKILLIPAVYNSHLLKQSKFFREEVK